jgi:hypothetical protein
MSTIQSTDACAGVLAIMMDKNGEKVMLAGSFKLNRFLPS